jgi:phosphatidylserine/phosphatidylglycerophosphate/cardiolipin synthase-like enzyme
VTGGRNVGARYFAAPADVPAAFSDTDLQVEGAATAAALGAVFARIHDAAAPLAPSAPDARARCRADALAAYEHMDAWLRDRAAPPRAGEWADALAALPGLRGALRDEPRPAAPTAPVRVLDSVPRPGGSGAVDAALDRFFATARRDVLLVTPYVVATERLAASLAAAGRRGVAVTIVTNGPVSSDNGLSQVFFRDQWPRLLARVPGLRIFASGSRMLHDKIAVVDERLAMVGSQNLDPLSLTVMGESAVVADSPALADALAAATRRRLRAGPPVVYEYRIRRDAAGRPVRDAGGAPVVAFGPRDHADPSTWVRPNLAWRLLGWLARPPFVPPLF